MVVGNMYIDICHKYKIYSNIYRGPLLSHLLGVASSTFTRVQ